MKHMFDNHYLMEFIVRQKQVRTAAAYFEAFFSSAICSLVGRGFFSAGVTCFSLPLLNVSTSLTLSAIAVL